MLKANRTGILTDKENLKISSFGECISKPFRKEHADRLDD